MLPDGSTNAGHPYHSSSTDQHSPQRQQPFDDDSRSSDAGRHPSACAVSLGRRSRAINWAILKAQYLQANRATQLDSLALNVTRIQVLARSGTDESVAQHLVRESQFFIERAVLGVNLETDIAFASDLVDLQRSFKVGLLG